MKLLLYCSSLIVLLNTIQCDNDVRQGRILSGRHEEPFIEKQVLQEYSHVSNASVSDATPDDVIEEIINSSRQGRNIEGLDMIYSDSNIKEALNTGNEIEARNLIRDKLCDLGLMQCDEIIAGKRPAYPQRVIYTQPPGPVYNSRPTQNLIRPPVQQPIKGIYGPPKPVPYPQNQPPRKIGYSQPALNTFESKPIAHDKFSSSNTFYEVDPNPSQIKFGYTEKPTIVVNQGKREASPGGSSLNHHVHHHYVHVEGNGNPGLIDGAKTVLVNTPISEYSAVNQLSSSYQTSGFGTTGAASNINGGFVPMNSNSNEYSGYTGVNSGNSGIYSGNSVKPVYETNYGTNFNKYQQSTGPAVYTEGTNGIYSIGKQSFHTASPDSYKKELNLNRGSGYSSQQQQFKQNYINSQNKQQLYSNKNQYNSGEQYQGFESARQDQFDCVCVPFDQCPVQDVVGRRDDLILPLDPRNLPTEIEADSDNSTVRSEHHSNSTASEEVKKVSKREVDRVQGEGRLLGLGNPGGYYPGPGSYPGGKKVLPTLGVSFGLPVPTYNYPISPYAPHAPNAHFGGLSPNGLNLGLVNVNPLFSLQVTKNELGEKLVKPFVNLHVTPNHGIIGTIGKIGGYLFHNKQALHKHYHLHRYPPPHSPYHGHHYSEFPPPNHSPHIGDLPPFLSHPPIGHHHEHGHVIDGPPIHGINGPQIHGPPHFIDGPHLPFLKDHRFGRDLIVDDISTNPGLLGFRSNNVSVESDQLLYPQNNFVNDELRYAGSYPRPIDDNDINKAKILHSIPQQGLGNYQGSEQVSFPTSRRRRDTDQKVPSSLEKKVSNEDAEDIEDDSEGRAYNGKRQAFYQQPQQQKQCGPRAVCCRKPFRNPQALQVPTANYNRCGVRNTNGITGRIKNPSYIDGDSEFGEWPWQAAILKKDPKESVYVCGGTLISDSYIVTAAHCVKTYSGFDLRVRLGEWDVNHDVEFYPYVERDVISVHVHPEYYAGTLDNDLAILKLSAPVDFSTNPHVTPACLPDKFTDFTRQRCWTTGWGKDNWEYGKYQNILKEVDVPIIDQNTCQNQLRQTRLGYNYVLNPGFICAGGEEGKDACKGDGGGPLVCERNGVWNLVGAVSWGIGCGQPNVPGVYVRISHYLNWIEQITRRY